MFWFKCYIGNEGKRRYREYIARLCVHLSGSLRLLLHGGALMLLFNGGCASKSIEGSSSIDRVGARFGLIGQESETKTKSYLVAHENVEVKTLIFEGPGWESDRVGYRLYLDQRNAVDVFGKRVTTPVLPLVGKGHSYHSMSDWGMDILKVGSSLGAGGFGILIDDEAKQIGPAKSYFGEIVEDTKSKATLRVVHRDSERCGNDIEAFYSIEKGRRATRVSLVGDCPYSFVAGLVRHDDTRLISSEDDDTMGWRYLASYGQQTLNNDLLGLAIFYRKEQVVSVSEDEDDHFIVFKQGIRPDYFLAAAWELEVDGIKNENTFKIWLAGKQSELNNMNK